MDNRLEEINKGLLNVNLDLTEENRKYKEALEKIVTRSMSMYATRDDMLRGIIEIAWKGLGK